MGDQYKDENLAKSYSDLLKQARDDYSVKFPNIDELCPIPDELKYTPPPMGK